MNTFLLNRRLRQVSSINTNTESIQKNISFEEDNGFFGVNTLWVSSKEGYNCIVLANGKWADIIDEKAEVKQKIQNLKNEIDELEKLI